MLTKPNIIYRTNYASWKLIIQFIAMNLAYSCQCRNLIHSSYVLSKRHHYVITSPPMRGNHRLSAEVSNPDCLVLQRNYEAVSGGNVAADTVVNSPVSCWSGILDGSVLLNKFDHSPCIQLATKNTRSSHVVMSFCTWVSRIICIYNLVTGWC